MEPSPTPLPAAAASERRARVFDAVRGLLADQGLRISMDAVAHRAGCSKQTLYSQFGSKRELLRQMMREHLDLAAAQLQPGGEPRQILLEFAREHLDRLAEPLVVASCQLFTAEAKHFPEEAQAIFRDGADTLIERLSAWLADAMARGLLRHEPPQFAAELFLSMIVGMDFERQRFAMPTRDVDARRAWAAAAVDAFLRAFAPS